MVILEALENILKSDEETYTTLVEEARGLDHIERLQTHANQDIYEKCLSIIETFWEVEEEEVEEEEVPDLVQDSNDNQDSN